MRCPRLLRFAWAALIPMALGSAGCQDAVRNNPLDPQLTPGVELLSVTFDSLAATTTLVWSRYRGDQPFKEYRINRQVSGAAAPETRGTVTSVADTTFLDAGVEVDRAYVYNVSVINTGGFEVASNAGQVYFVPGPPELRVVFDGPTASAVLSWSRAGQGFDHYEIHRQTEGETGTLILHGTDVINDTTFVDEGLKGNTLYTYKAVTQLSTGRELESQEGVGRIYSFQREREWRQPGGGFLNGAAAMGPDGRVYVSATLPDPDPIHVFNIHGTVVDEFATDPSPDDASYECVDLAVGQAGVYALLWEPAAGDEQAACYVSGVDLAGARRFRWPASGGRLGLGAIAVSADGALWVAQRGSGGAADTLYVVDAITGGLKTRISLRKDGGSQGTGRMALSVGSAQGALADGSDLVVFDTSTGQVLPATRTGDSRIFDISMVGDGRLFVLTLDPPRIEVLRDGNPLTSWDLEVTGGFNFHFKDDAPKAGIALDAQGGVYVFDPFIDRLRVQVFGP